MQFEHTYHIYSHREDGIHVFRFAKPNRKSIDEHFEQMDNLLANHPPDEPFLLLFDLRDGYPPGNYVIRAGLRFYQSHNLPKFTRGAYLHKVGSLASILRMVMESLHLPSQRRLFEESHEDEAIAWLLAEREAYLHEKAINELNTQTGQDKSS